MTSPEAKFVVSAEDRATAILKRVESNLGGMANAARSAAGLMGVLGAALPVAALITFVKSTINAQDAVAKLSDRMGIAVKDVVGFQHAASLAGTEIEAVEKAFKSLAMKMYEASGGSQEARRMFRDLGVAYTDVGGGLKDTQKAFMEVIDALSKMPDVTRRTTLANLAFAKSGQAMLVLGKDGAAGLRKIKEEAEKLNPMTEESVRQSEKFNDNLERLAKSGTAFSKTLVIELLPGMSQMVTLMANARLAGDGLLATLMATQLPHELKRNMERLDFLRREMKTAKGAEREIYNADATALERRNSEIYALLAKYNPQEPNKPKEDPTAAAAAAVEAAKKAKAAAEAEAQAKRRAAEIERGRKAAQESIDTTLRELALGENATELAKTRAEIETGRYQLASREQKQQLLLLAAHRDALKQIGDEEADRAAQRQRAWEALAAEADAVSGIAYGTAEERESEGNLRRLNKAWEENKRLLEEARTPLQALHAEYERLNELWKTGLLTQEAYAFGAEKAARAFEDQTAVLKETNDVAKELGLTFESAFERAVVGGQKLSAIVQGLGRDLAMMAVRQYVTKPMFKSLTGFLDNIFGGGGFIDPISGVRSNTRSFAMGGVMTSAGALPLNRYESGGIANRPQLALFGEGRMPEAYVPLPDGRRIPVAMKGGGGGVNITQHITVTGGASRQDVMAAMSAAKESAKREILEDMRRGGVFS